MNKFNLSSFFAVAMCAIVGVTSLVGCSSKATTQDQPSLSASPGTDAPPSQTVAQANLGASSAGNSR